MSHFEKYGHSREALSDRSDRTRTDKEDSKLSAPCAVLSVDLKLTHIECSPGNILVHFQGQDTTICELDYNILQVEIQNVYKTAVSVEVGDMCLVEDILSNRWYRGRVQNKSRNLFDVFLVDYGTVLTVGPNYLSAVSDSLLTLPPKIVRGYIANVLPVNEYWDQLSEAYFSSLVGRHIEGYIHGLLPYNILILEVAEVTKDLLSLNLGRHVDTDTFVLLLELEIDAPVQQSCKSVPDLLTENQIAQEISFSFKSSKICGYENILSLAGSKLVVGQQERVRIAAGVNAGLFYCQLSSAAKDLKEMSEKLELVCESRSGDFRDKPGENMGLLCAIKGKDEKWHRGLLQCLPVNSHVRVVFVDYGYCESVKVEDIFQLPSDFLLRPVMAFPCSLSCLGAKDKASVNQQMELLRRGVLGEELVITVHDLSKENVCSVTLSTVDKRAPFVTGQYQEINDMTCSGIPTNVHQLRCNETDPKNMGPPKNLLALEDIPDGSVFPGYVEHVQSPHDFWIRTAKSNDRFEAMMNKLTDWFSRLPLNDEILQDPTPGQLCCAMYEKDMHYYRALVVDILEYGAEVFFIDFGNTEMVPSMLIKKIPTEFTAEPAFAVSCSLAHVVPLEDVWTATATDFFSKATSNKVLLVHVISRKCDVLVVELYEKGVEKNESIMTLLTSANMAEYWTYNAIKTPGTPVEKNNKTRQRFAKGQFAQKSSKCIPQKPPSKVTRQDKATDKQINTKTQKYSAVEIFKFQKFKPGAVISVQCSHVSSPSEFWCQDKKNKNDLDRLMERLQTFYQKNTSVLQPNSVSCAVQNKRDNKWYRGCIHEGTALKVKVLLVDYGVVVQEKLKNLQALNPEFLELEMQAFRCSLYNVIGPIKGDTWSVEATTLLRDFTSGSICNLTCKIYSQVYVANKGFCNVVDLYTPHRQASTHLIEKGVAKKIQPWHLLLPSVYPCSFVYSSFDIIIGSEELVFPTHVVSPWEIYLQLDRNTDIIEHLMDRAMKESEALMSQMHSGTPGNVCLAKYSEDGKWYRSFVWPAQSSLHFNVFFVDYGSKQVAEKKNVLSIPMKAVDLLSTPMQALRCSLSGVPEEEHLPEVNTWLEKATVNKGLRAKFVGTNSSGHFICELFDGGIHINEKVREIFTIHGQKGKSVKKPGNNCCKEVVNVSSTDRKCKTKGRHHVESVSVKSYRSPGHSEVTQGNGQYCPKKFSKLKYPKKSHNLNGSSEKNGQGKDKHSVKPAKQLQNENCTIPGASKVQPSKVLPNVSDLPAIKIAPGFQSTGFISHRVSVDSFFIQMEKDEQNILKMRAELNSSPFTESLQSITLNVKVGDLVAAVYDEDFALYRAAVTSVASDGCPTVEFVDYGNTATVDKTKIHPLASKFLSKARLSIHCKLSKQHNLEDVESFLSDAHDNPLMVEFVQNLGYAWEVSVQALVNLHEPREPNPAQGTENKVLDSGQGQDQYASVNEDMSLTSVFEKTEAETLSVKEEAKILERGTKDIKVVHEKTLAKVQARRATCYMPKLRTKSEVSTCKPKCDEKQDVCQDNLPQKPEIFSSVTDNEVSNLSNNSCGKTSSEQSEIVRVDEQDVGVKTHQSFAHQPTSEHDYREPLAILPEKPMDKEDEIRHLFLAPVKKDHEYSGFAAAITTPGEFYVVLEDLLLIMSAISSVLEDLPEDLAPLPKAHLIPGTGCLVKSEEKKKWCRAEIIQCDDISVIISLVDYGYCAHLALQDVCKLKALPVDIAGLPKITYPCLLRGIMPADELQWSDHAAMFFQQCTYQKNLHIYFREYVSEGQWEVDVITDDRNVAQELVDAGHAHYIDSVFGHKREIVSNCIENVSEDVSGQHEQTDSKMEEVPRRCLEDLSLDDDEEISKGCSTEEETEDPSSESSGKHGSAQKKYYGLQSRISQCVSGLQ